MKRKILRVIFIMFSLLTILITIKIFVGDLYYTPTNSMEDTIGKKSYLLVSKTDYGAILPKTSHQIPFFSKIFRNMEPIGLWDDKRLTGFCDVKRNDIVLAKFYTMNVVKRIVGMPGDTISIENGFVLLNSINERIIDSYRYNFEVVAKKHGIKESNRFPIRDKDSSNLTSKIWLNGSDLNKILSSFQLKANFNKVDTSYIKGIYPKAKRLEWTRNNYGKYLIPFKGMKIELTESNFELYERILLNDENIDIKQFGSHFFINGEKEKFYSFKNDYFFLMGDNRMESRDSRFLGVFAKKNLIGKVRYWFQ